MSFKHIVVMPKMSMTMETGELISYHVTVGQQVKSGDLLFEVMTDKIDMDVDAPADGTITALVGAVGATIEIGKPVLEMETETQVLSFDFSQPAAPIQEVQEVQEVVVAPPVIETPVIQTPVIEAAVVLPTSVCAVPKARQMAKDKGIDIRTVIPTGPDQTIMAADVEGAKDSPELAQRRAANQALIASRITEGALIPQATFTKIAEIDGKASEAKLMKAWARVLKEALNTEIGVAKVTQSIYGSALPVYKNIESMETSALATLVESTTNSARLGKVPLAMLSGATTTLFDLRSMGIESARLGLLPGQSSTLTVGQAKKNKISLSLTVDLRVFDLYDAATLMERLITIL